MDKNHVKGENKGHVMLYALSTCVWCKKTKKLLEELGVEYYYIDVDLVKGKKREEITEEIKQWNPRCSFPTLVIRNEICIIGFEEDRIREVLE